MKLDEYQERTEKTAVYPTQEAVEYLALGLNDESDVGGMAQAQDLSRLVT